MSSARQRSLAILRPAVAAGVGLTLLLAGCGTGQEAQTAIQAPAVDGAQEQAGPIAVRNAQLAYPEGGQHYYPAGSNAPLLVTIVNTGATEDELTSVNSPFAGSVRIDGQRALPAQRTLRSAGSSGQDSDAGQGLAQGQVRIVLENLAADVKPGKTIPVTLLFRQAGEVTMDVPIGQTDEPRTDSTH